MLKSILKTVLKLFIAAIVIRVGMLAIGAYVLADQTGGVSPDSIMEMRDTGLEALEVVTRMLGK